jgi:hypothetical protein
MMRAMGKRTITVATALALVACGGGGKHADSPGNCPDGTVLKGEDCVPPGDDSAPSGSGGGGAKGGGGDDGDKPSSGGSGGGGGDEPAAGGKTAYDKDAVEVQLKRAARQVKSNCGAATDDEGKATGPWGSTKASVVLGRNGHVKQVTVPSPYDGKPVGICVVHAFQRIQFPPYAGSTDVVVDWDVEINKPK